MATSLPNILNNRIIRGIALAFFLVNHVCIASAQQDSIIITPETPVVLPDSTSLAGIEKTNNLNQVYWNPDPNKAMWYSVLCPGLGQIYNRSYWKVPVIYGGAAVFGYLISWQGRMYNDYSNAYYDFMDNDPNTRSYDRLFKNIPGTDDWKRNTLRKKRDSYRRYRDLCIFGVGLPYVLNIVDAFVDGHLYDFSVTNDLSFHVDPYIQPQYEGFGIGNTSYGLQCSFTF